MLSEDPQPSLQFDSNGEDAADKLLAQAGVKEFIEEDPSAVQWLTTDEFTTTTSVSIQEYTHESFMNEDIHVSVVNTTQDTELIVNDVAVEALDPPSSTSQQNFAQCVSVNDASYSVVVEEEEDDESLIWVPTTPPRHLTKPSPEFSTENIADDADMVAESELGDNAAPENVQRCDDDSGWDEVSSSIPPNVNYDEYEYDDEEGTSALDGMLPNEIEQMASTLEENDNASADCMESGDSAPTHPSSSPENENLSQSSTDLEASNAQSETSCTIPPTESVYLQDWERVYGCSESSQQAEIPSTPEPQESPLPLLAAAELQSEADDSTTVIIPIAKDGTFNDADHPSLSRESLAKVRVALAKCAKTGKYPSRITVKKEKVKKGAGKGGIVKESGPSSSNGKNVFRGLWNPLRRILSGLGFASQEGLTKDTEMD
ncbi:hypothetical protein BCR33DRAFT_715022 [Rhizoclosmatium globosum]|uniref:Uncharacterized protein n=1 Tax=Rhizoclosmatium globosum TaxID=329046 RepID=A0A1Y2CK85_9FUNG|nr:hypothetical protein BCR33DRAFT_715022 [Rhizoclosmatium globosum]|eukprot:ORY47274.1 hypothetical protein BCR33DRAFT_715022 [Rhizoclosmatium globosum]